MKRARKRTRFNDPGMRRVRLLLWRLYYKTPLDQVIDEAAEREAARTCKLSWEQYGELKAKYPDQWAKWEAKRAKAVREGGFPPQPPQFRRYRKVDASREKKYRAGVFGPRINS